MATLASLTLDCLDMLYGQTPHSRPDLDTLATAVADAADTLWQFNQAGNQFWARGDYAERFLGTGVASEVVLLLEDHDTAAADVEVLRAQRRTTAAGGFAAGDAFLRNPPFTHTEIQKEINAVVDSDLQVGLWYRQTRKFSVETGRNRYPLEAGDFQVERLYQADTQQTEIGAASFTAADNRWTLTDHGLSVGDAVRFTSDGGDPEPTEYTTGTVYWVVAVPTTSTFELSKTEGGSTLGGANNSTDDWTVATVGVFNFREIDVHGYEVISEVTSEIEPTGRALLVRSYWSADAPLYAVVRSRPDSTAIADLPSDIAAMIPWGTLSRLTGGTVSRQRYGTDDTSRSTISFADSEFFRLRFEDMVDRYKTKLLTDLQPARRFRMGPISG